MPQWESLPHVYPFRFVDRMVKRGEAGAGRVRVAWTANAKYAGSGLWRSVLPEVIAQSALLLQGGDPDLGRTGFLAGVSGFTVERAPHAGETLNVDVKVAGQFGPIVKFEGSISGDGGSPIASGAVTVRQGTRGLPSGA